MHLRQEAPSEHWRAPNSMRWNSNWIRMASEYHFGFPSRLNLIELARCASRESISLRCVICILRELHCASPWITVNANRTGNASNNKWIARAIGAFECPLTDLLRSNWYRSSQRERLKLPLAATSKATQHRRTSATSKRDQTTTKEHRLARFCKRFAFFL